MIGDNIEIRVVEIHGDKVRLSFNAPREIGIDRKELYVQKKQQDPNYSAGYLTVRQEPKQENPAPIR